MNYQQNQFCPRKGRTPRFGMPEQPQVVINNATPCCNDRVEEVPQFVPQPQFMSMPQQFVEPQPMQPQFVQPLPMQQPIIQQVPQPIQPVQPMIQPIQPPMQQFSPVQPVINHVISRNPDDCVITVCSSHDTPQMRIEKLQAMIEATEAHAKLGYYGMSDDSFLSTDLVFLKPKPEPPPAPVVEKPKSILGIIFAAVAATAIVVGGAAAAVYFFVL